MKVELQENFEIGKGDMIFSHYFYDNNEGCDIVPHDCKDDSDRKDPFLNTLYQTLNMLPGRLLFIREKDTASKTIMKLVIKKLWNIEAQSYHDDLGFEFVCDEGGVPVTLAKYMEDGSLACLFLYLPRGVKDHEIPSYTDEELKTALEEALNA